MVMFGNMFGMLFASDLIHSFVISAALVHQPQSTPHEGQQEDPHQPAGSSGLGPILSYAVK